MLGKISHNIHKLTCIKFQRQVKISFLCSLTMLPRVCGDGGNILYNEDRQEHMVAVLESSMWQISFPAYNIDRSGDFEEEKAILLGPGGSGLPSGAQRTLTHPIYLYL